MPYAYTAYLYKNIKDNRRHNVSCISRFCNYFSKNVVDLDVNNEVSRYLKNLCADNDTRKSVDNIVQMVLFPQGIKKVLIDVFYHRFEKF